MKGRKSLNKINMASQCLVMSIVGIVVYTSLGRTSNDSGRVALRSTKIPLKNQHDSVPPIMMFDGYEIAPAYIEDRTDYACGDKTCYSGESCHQTNPSSQYVLVSDGVSNPVTSTAILQMAVNPLQLPKNVLLRALHLTALFYQEKTGYLFTNVNKILIVLILLTIFKPVLVGLPVHREV